MRIRFKQMMEKEYDTGFFQCRNCGRPVTISVPGTSHRNHCPFCLWSLHVDIKSGDRRSFCRGKMEPVSIWVKDDGEWAILHRCVNCGFIRPNRLAGDDDERQLRNLANRPLETPAFPA